MKLLQWENTALLIHSSDLINLSSIHKNLYNKVWQFLSQSINAPQTPLKPQSNNTQPLLSTPDRRSCWKHLSTKPSRFANENKVKKCLDQLQDFIFFLISWAWRFPQTDTELGEQRELYTHPWHPDLSKCRQAPTFPAVAVVTQQINRINFHLSL